MSSWWPFGKRDQEFHDIPLRMGRRRNEGNYMGEESLPEKYEMDEEPAREEKQLYYDESLYEGPKGSKWPQKIAMISMGFGMGFFVGSSVVAASALVNPRMRQMGWQALRPHAVGAGITFGTIFAGGQILQTW
eukprot:CAMPEP_0184478266 /NCGR_PEP_ID=MMETSP0113_2-20130426/331_1 /TAXON_ID=91329 /ORGANISM="Norrisiella sphaerica, Strain BC52" /LENGTH=132 /DNA_ID=CAMNT_0026855979 /DNA_START=1 /DNA_END=396 /DNA_ORIENTATION=+